MYRLEGTSPYDVDEPIFNANEKIQRIVDFLADGTNQVGSALEPTSSVWPVRAESLGRRNRRDGKKTRNDDRWHRLVQGYAGMWGHPTFFAATCPRSHSRREAIDELGAYMAAEKHQMQSDRS